MAERRIRLPPLLDDEIKRECECNPAPLAVDERAIDMGYTCVKCGHEIKWNGFLRLLRSYYRVR